MPHDPVSLWPDPDALGTLTDLYQLTMMAGYAAAGIADKPAVFELFVRKLPDRRAYLVFAGLEQAVGDLLRLRFSPEQVDYIRMLPAFATIDPAWFDRLAALRFTGHVWAAPEGSVVFPGETLLRVEAPLIQAQWVETYLLASLGYATLVASKAARIVEAAAGRSLFEFGARRGPGPQAGLIAARAAYLAGFDGTSNVEAARRLGIPPAGTMAHSWVQAFDSEPEAFDAFARAFPGGTTLLVDTYDTPEGVRRAAAVEPPVRAVRLDSGDPRALAVQTRQILDDAGRRDVKILVSGDMNEGKIADLVAAGAPIDGFGVGTDLITNHDAPALAMVYKLVALDGTGRVKLSPGKRTYPLAKQVWRRRDGQGRFAGDHVTRADEIAEGDPLLAPVIHNGQLVAPLPKLDTVRAFCKLQRQSLPENLHGVYARPSYSITYSDALEAEADRLGLRPKPQRGILDAFRDQKFNIWMLMALVAVSAVLLLGVRLVDRDGAVAQARAAMKAEFGDSKAFEPIPAYAHRASAFEAWEVWFPRPDGGMYVVRVGPLGGASDPAIQAPVLLQTTTMPTVTP